MIILGIIIKNKIGNQLIHPIPKTMPLNIKIGYEINERDREYLKLFLNSKYTDEMNNSPEIIVKNPINNIKLSNCEIPVPMLET